MQTIKRKSWIRCHNTMVCGSGVARLGTSIFRGNQCNPEEGMRFHVEYINCWSVETADWWAVEERKPVGCACLVEVYTSMEPYFNLHWVSRKDPSHVLNKYVQPQLVPAMYAYKHVQLQLTYPSTYFFNWSVPRTPTCTYISTGPYHTYKYVRTTRCIFVEYVERMRSNIRIFL